MITQFAVFEREPQFSRAEFPIVFGPYKTAEEAEAARQKYGLVSENFYVAKIAQDRVSPE